MTEKKAKEKQYETDPEIIREMFDKWKSPHEADKKIFRDWATEQFQQIVISIAWKHFGSFMGNKTHCDDLIQSGWVGIFAHAHEYDPLRSGLYTFFWPIIHHEMTEYVNQNISKMTRHTQANVKKVREAQTRLNDLGIPNPTVAEISNESGLSQAIVLRTMESIKMRETRNIDDVTDAQAPEEYDPEVAVIQKETKEVLKTALQHTLDPLEREVLCRKYGLFGYSSQDTRTIAAAVDIGVDQISRILTNCYTKLRTNPGLISQRLGKKQEILRDLKLEPVTITPDAAAQRTMDQLQMADICEELIF